MRFLCTGCPMENLCFTDISGRGHLHTGGKDSLCSGFWYLDPAERADPSIGEEVLFSDGTAYRWDGKGWVFGEEVPRSTGTSGISSGRTSRGHDLGT